MLNSVSLMPQAMNPTQPTVEPPGDWFVYLIWDASPEERGEKPDLVCVFVSEEMAQAFIDESYADSDQISIEESRVVGALTVTVQSQTTQTGSTLINGTWPSIQFLKGRS